MRVRDRQKVKKKYPNGGTGGWNLKKPINKIDALREEILDLQQQNLDLATKKQVEPVEENSIGDTDMQPIDKGSSLIGTIKEKKWLVLGLVAVAGFFAYKKFKK